MARNKQKNSKKKKYMEKSEWIGLLGLAHLKNRGDSHSKLK
jgi:hypothetical protein